MEAAYAVSSAHGVVFFEYLVFKRVTITAKTLRFSV